MSQHDNDITFEDRYLLPEGTPVMPLVTRFCSAHGKRTPVFSGEPGVVTRAARDIYSKVVVDFPAIGASLAYMPQEVAAVDQTVCPFDLRRNIVLKTRIGSHAHGIAHAESDDDLRGVFVAPPELHWSLAATPRRIEYLRHGVVDELYYEVEGFLRRMLTGDPMVMETLFSHLILEKDEVGEELLRRRNEFLTRPALMGFPYFLREQIRDLGRRHRRGSRVKPKALMHTLRLALSGLRAMQTGEMTLEAREHAADLIAVREGQWHFDKVNQHVHEALRQFDRSLNSSPLSPYPAIATADECLVFARAWYAKKALLNGGMDAVVGPGTGVMRRYLAGTGSLPVGDAAPDSWDDEDEQDADDDSEAS